ncbi:nucleoside diphosphate kinase [Methanocella conradii HZ254]|uniref:Nucleoside diphosphate kinase n=1 Tax=Methanocella conradii (strain DSM 24694 / JCM 17849 / CGMCC 1.5162 / HZ254) TaxID=1041930 RepID=H8I4Q8_METCZ|nr:nucleoside-diphosphate kinase [Methanocella conradii]AFD00653.1 nucleoside diphosphate kinase [Methanocella conradii HZ254]MDI6896351.1 nucleoside-diphosphate kinase [Methanocella conradii]
MVCTDRTFVMIKPDGVQRGLIGDIVSRFERRGLKIVAMKMLVVSDSLAKKHYEEHAAKPFFPSLVSFIKSGPVVAMVVEGRNAVPIVRSMVGATSPSNSSPGTIRGDLALETGRNVIHASDSPESAKREISLYFDNSEIATYKRIDEQWLYE